ncbi:MAG: dihydroorotate dehydrogenase electron transfer subunit [Thermoplasmata archaeon]
MRQIVTVAERVEETPSTATLRFRYEAPARPGQFIMVWLPGEDELPMSLSYVGPVKGVTIKKMGATSGHLKDLRVGAALGVRGPYGNSFDLSPGRILLVGGGSGTAVLAPAAEAARAAGGRITAALGGTTASEVLYGGRLSAVCESVRIATDDGSSGHAGFVTEVARALLDAEPFDAVWTCGPEVMMRKVIEMAGARAVPVFCSVERQMKCALGLCDACALGPFHVCTDGPVFPAAALLSAEEFGRFQRDASGRRIGRGAAPGPSRN